MKNYVGFSKEIFNTLFIGCPVHPVPWEFDDDSRTIVYKESGFTPHEKIKGYKKVESIYPIDLALDPNVIVAFHQTGGLACARQPLFGMFFPLEDESLVALANEYYSSGIVPYTLTLDCILDWKSKINEFGLDFSGIEYQYMQEGFLPVDFPTAFKYAKRERLSNLRLNNGSFSTSNWIDQMNDENEFVSWFGKIINEVSIWSPEGVERYVVDELETTFY